MRGSDAVTGSLFSYVDLEDRVPANQPQRVIREVVNEVLVALDAEFSAMYSASSCSSEHAVSAHCGLANSQICRRYYRLPHRHPPVD